MENTARWTGIASRKFKALAVGMGINIAFIIAYPFIFFLVLPNAKLQLLPKLISNIGVTWNQFFFDFYILGELVMFTGFIIVPLLRRN